MAAQFDYPARGWSTGRMRKRGQRPGETEVAMDYTRRGQPESALAEMERAAGFGIAARGGSMGAVTGVTPQATAGTVSKAYGKEDVQDAINQVAMGDLTMQGFKKLLKKWGWSGSPDTGVFTDPAGKEHNIQPAYEE